MSATPGTEIAGSAPGDSTRIKKKRAPGGGRKPKFDAAMRDQLVALLATHPGLTLVELSSLAKAELGISAGTLTLAKALKQQGVSRQKVKREQAASSSDVSAPKPAKRYGYAKRHRELAGHGNYLSNVTDAEWALVADLFENHGSGRRPKVSRRQMLDAVMYAVRGGVAWRMLPAEFPEWSNVYATFRRWVRQGIMETMYDRLRGMMRERADRAVEPTAAILDSQSVKTSPQGGPKGYDGGKKVTGRKRHLVVDTLGLLLAVWVTTANVQDRDAAAPVLAAAKKKYPSLKKTYVDAGYTGAKTAAAAAQHGIELEVVKRPQFGNRQWVRGGDLPLFPEDATAGKPFPILPKRWIVERNNAWSERPRRMNRDHDQLPAVSTAWIWLVHARMLLAKLTQPV